ncbi:hypothetical protein ACOMHN_032033 [Nucella lapillus]
MRVCTQVDPGDCKQEPLLTIVKRRKLSWFSHVNCHDFLAKMVRARLKEGAEEADNTRRSVPRHAAHSPSLLRACITRLIAARNKSSHSEVLRPPQNVNHHSLSVIVFRLVRKRQRVSEATDKVGNWRIHYHHCPLPRLGHRPPTSALHPLSTRSPSAPSGASRPCRLQARPVSSGFAAIRQRGCVESEKRRRDTDKRVGDSMDFV